MHVTRAIELLLWTFIGQYSTGTEVIDETFHKKAG